MIDYPQVVLSSGNIAHYNQTALVLQQAGILQRYLCTFDGQETTAWWGGLLSMDQRRRIQGKHIPGLDSKRIKTFPAPYLIAQSLRRNRLISMTQANSLFGAWHDRLTIPYAQEGNVFHFVNSLGLRTAERAARYGIKVICDVREAHIWAEDEILSAEYERLGLNYRSKRTLNLQRRILAEYDLADHLLVMSTYAKESFLSRGYSPLKVHVVPLGVDTTRFTKTKELAKLKLDDVFRVIFVGQILPAKGLHYLIKSMQKANLPNSELIVLGSINDSEYAHLHLPMSDTRIRFVGHVPQIELWHWYQKADIFVLPSLSDGFAMVVSEAMALGLPVIVTENVGARDLVRDGYDGFIVPVGSEEALTEKIVWFYEHPEECREMGLLAKEQIQAFTWVHYGERLLAAYHKIFQSD